MYKSKQELLKMSVEEIAAYIVALEKNDSITKVNGLEYVDWCQHELSDALEDMGFDPLYFFNKFVENQMFSR